MAWCLKVLLNLTMLRYFGAIVAFIYWRKLDKSNSTFASRAFQTERIIWIHLHDIGFRTTLRWPCEWTCKKPKLIINVYFCCYYYIIQIHKISDLMLIRTSFIPNHQICKKTDEYNRPTVKKETVFPWQSLVYWTLEGFVTLQGGKRKCAW